jgi:hypothetical protein
VVQHASGLLADDPELMHVFGQFFPHYPAGPAIASPSVTGLDAEFDDAKEYIYRVKVGSPHLSSPCAALCLAWSLTTRVVIRPAHVPASTTGLRVLCGHSLRLPLLSDRRGSGEPAHQCATQGTTTAFPPCPFPQLSLICPHFSSLLGLSQNYPSLLASFKQFLPHRP